MLPRILEFVQPPQVILSLSAMMRRASLVLAVQLLVMLGPTIESCQGRAVLLCVRQSQVPCSKLDMLLVVMTRAFAVMLVAVGMVPMISFGIGDLLHVLLPRHLGIRVQSLVRGVCLISRSFDYQRTGRGLARYYPVR